MDARYFLGIDGGGTKTEAVLIDQTGRILARDKAGSSNPNDVGLDQSVDLLIALSDGLLRKTGLTPADVNLFGGISGVINHRDAMLRMISDRRHYNRLDVQSDGINLVSSELDEGDGAAIICGTGSACFLRMGRELIRIGGWGYLLDSAGSGYDIGRQAVEAALRAHDKRGEATLLSGLITEALGAPAEQSITKLYAEGKPLIASLAPLVFKADEQGDRQADLILDRNAAALAEYIVTAYRWLCDAGRQPARMPVVIGGGIGQHYGKRWTDRIAAHVGKDVPADISVACNPVVWGPVVEAVRLNAAHDDLDKMKATFLRDYTKPQTDAVNAN